MDIQQFLNVSLAPRSVTIEVPELASFFGDESPEWTVRGLTAAELGRANEYAAKGQSNLKALIEAMAGTGDKAEALRKSMGLSEDEVPEDVSRRIELLTAGSVSPKIGQENRDVAVRLAESFPTVFYNLTNNVLNLTGQGAEVGKPKPSGKTKK